MTDWAATKDDQAGYEVRVAVPDESAFATAVQSLVDDQVASGIRGQDATLWGTAAQDESSKRLAWVDLHETSRGLVGEIESLRTELAERGLDHVVLCGMGGSSLAPEVICETAGVELKVLDSSDPDYVRAALADRLERSIVVVSSKSGGTVETDSQRRAYEQAFTEADLSPADHIVVVTDPGSPLDKEATGAGYRVFHADPSVGGRYSALTAFGLVPSGLAGADIGALLDEASAIDKALSSDDADNPGLRLGALLGIANHAGVDKVVLATDGTPIVGFGDWAEQLIAESTGKEGKGILPVVVPDTSAPNYDPDTADEVLVALGGSGRTGSSASGFSAAVFGPLGAQMLLWEYATVVAGRLIGINPFDQPDVESAKQAARGLLGATGGDQDTAAFEDRGIEVYDTNGWLPEDVTTIQAAVAALLDHLDPERGYVAIQAYLDRDRDTYLPPLRESLATRTGRPVTFGWGPRFLHSTGQYHKGGPGTGVYLQLTGTPREDLAIEGREFTFGEFIAAQAVGDATVLSDHGRPVLRLHLDGSDSARAVVQEALS